MPDRKTAVVTGAGGFVGRALVDHLVQAGYLVRALVHRLPLPALPAGVMTFGGDVRDVELVRECVKGANAVFHVAAKLPSDGSPQDETEVFEVTVEGTRNVLDAAVATKAETLVYLSSLSIHGRVPPGLCDEQTPIAPRSAYGCAKAAAEQMVIEASHHSSLRTTCLRPPMVYGVGCPGGLPRMVRRAARGFFLPLPRNSGRRSLLHIKNLLDACVLAATNHRSNGQCYVVTDTQSYSISEIFELIRRSMSKRYPSWELPMSLLEGAAGAGDVARRLTGRRFPFDSERLENLVGSSEFSSAKIRRELGYQARFALKEELPRIIEDVIRGPSKDAT